MQNTSRIQQNPDTLISNFFIAGLQQETIQECFTPTVDLSKLYNLKPEVLFTLYQETDTCKSYLQQVFPDKITIHVQEELVNPKFFTFMTTDQSGFNSYFHCLTYFERFTEDLIKNDFDPNTAFEKAWKQARRENFIKELKRPASTQLRNTQTNSSDSFVGEEENKYGANNMSRKDRNHILHFNANRQEEKKGQDDSVLQRRFEAMKNSSANAQIMRMGTTEATKGRGLQQQPPELLKISSTKTYNPQTSTTASTQPTLNTAKSAIIGGLTEVIEVQAEQDVEVTSVNSGTPKDNMNGIEMQTSNEHFDSFFTKVYDKGNFPQSQGAHKSGPISDVHNSDKRLNLAAVTPERSQTTANSTAAQAKAKIQENYYYAPIAFVIKTEIEHHDIFKEVLVSLFESIRKPKEITKNKLQDEKVSFADFLAHIAFLATIPCPDFNTVFKIEFLGKELILKEKPFHDIPDKNQIALRVMFEILDVKTIMYCWKALLFDYSLILISSSTSLQFYIAEALKQLLFPLTWQHNYIQPANDDLLDYADSPVPIIFCVSPIVKDFDQFELDIKSANFMNMAVCDIDGSFTNDCKFPVIQYEKEYIRTIMNLKNEQISQFDNAFPDQNANQLQFDKDRFVTEIRQLFMYMLQFFLQNVEQCFREEFNADNKFAVFANYFDKEKYLQRYEDTENVEFAKHLAESACFQHFCDDKFSSELTNYQMYIKILSRNEEFTDETKIRQEQQMFKKLEKDFKLEEMDESFDVQRGRLDSAVSQKTVNDSVNELSPDEAATFFWRMPQDNQRVMLFEKLQYTVQIKEFIDKQDKLLREEITEKNFAKYNKQVVDAAHEEELRKLYQYVFDLKILYASKLDEYNKQCQLACKGIQSIQQNRQYLINLNTENNQSTENPGQLSPLINKQFKRMQTTNENKSSRTMKEDDDFEISPVRKDRPQKPGVSSFDEERTTLKTGVSSNIKRIQVERLSAEGEAQVIDVTKEDENDLRVIKEDSKENKLQKSAKFGGGSLEKQGSKDSEQSYLFSDEAEQERKKTDYMKQKQSSNDSSHFHLDLKETEEPQKKLSNISSKLRSQSTFKEDSSYLDFGAQQEISQNMAQQRKLTAISAVTINEPKSQIYGYAGVNRSDGHNESHNLVQEMEKARHKDGKDLAENKHRITALTYGQGGLINFLDTLFTQFDYKVDIHKHFNYYFALKKQLQLLEEYSEGHHVAVKNSILTASSKGREMRRFNAQMSENNEMFKLSATDDKLSNKNALSLLEVSPRQRRNSEKPVAEDKNNQVNQSINVNKGAVKDQCENLFEEEDERRGDRHVWVLPKEWREKPKAIKHSYQFIMLKVKLQRQFEDTEEAKAMMLDEFMSFPQRERDIFSKTRFEELLRLLTEQQKRRYITLKLRKKEQSFQMLILYQHLLDQEKALKQGDELENYSLNHELFADIDIQKHVKKRDAKNKPKAVSAQVSLLEPSIAGGTDQSGRRSALRKPRERRRSTSGESGNCCSKNSSVDSGRKGNKQDKQSLLKKKNQLKQKIDQDKKEPDWLSKIFHTNKKIKPTKTEKEKIKKSQSTAVMGKSFDGKSINASQSSVHQSSKNLLATVDENANMETLNSIDMSGQHKMTESLPTKAKIDDAEQFSLNLQKLDQIQQSFANTSAFMQQKTIQDPYKKAIKLLTSIIDLYRENFRLIDTKSYKFPEKDLHRIQNELCAIKQKEKKFAESLVEFIQPFDEPEHMRQIQVIKQCFWLNILNYMTLRKLCEIQLTQPRLLKKLDNYTMWECFKVTNTIAINGSEISSYDIFHTMLGQSDIDHTVGSRSVFKTKTKSLEDFKQDVQLLAVTEPHQFIYFGSFYPVRKMPRLEVFNKEEFDEQLRRVMQINTEQHIQIRPDNFLVRLPKVLFWIKKLDNNTKSDFESILRLLLKHNIIADDSNQKQEIKQVLDQIELEKTHQAGNRQCQHLVEYDTLQWCFDLSQMETNLNIVVREIKNKEERNTAIMNHGAIFDSEDPLASAAEHSLTAETPATAAFLQESPQQSREKMELK